MSATNLDLPVLISAEQIRRREFVTIRRGYDPDQVRAYLEQLADQVELMRVLLREARAEADTAARTTAQQPRHDPYEQLGERVASVIREADQVAETIRGEAHRDAERLTLDARADADRIRTDAQAKAEDARARADAAVRTAREEADRTIAGLATRRDALVEQLASMKERLIGVAHELEGAMDVRVALPDIASITELLDEPSERNGTNGGGAVVPGDGPSVGVQASDGLIASEPMPVAPRDPDDASGGPGSTAADPSSGREPLVVVGEAGDDPADDGPSVLDPAYEELWEGTDAMRFDLPDIPALDLDWGEGDDDVPSA
ncbi:MAG: DivIVA domain-containing protein [Actinomycetota bacterium]